MANRRSLKFNVVWAIVVAAVMNAGQARSQQLIAWPIGQPSPLRFILPGMPVHPLPRPFPRPPAPQPETPITLSDYQVEGSIDDQAADLTYRIVFHNPTASRAEGVLIVPIPADTALSNFSMTVGGKTMKGELLEAGQAATIYEDIVRQLRDPGLLELVGERMLRARVFPIEPNSDVEVRLQLAQTLHKSGELTSLTVPLKSARMTQGASGRGSIRLTLSASQPLRALYSPNPAVAITKDGDAKARIVYEPASAAAAEDLNLYYSVARDPLSASLLTFKEEGEDGYFMLSLSPRARVDEKSVAPKDVVFVVDRSGSMQEDGKIDQAKGALAYCLKRLGARDRFAVVDFATDASSFESRLVPATPGNVSRALRYVERIEASGGTNVEAGLDEGLKMLRRDEGRVPLVFFITDGVPTVGRTDVGSLLASARQANASLGARVFTFGVGADVNTLLLDKLAEENRGAHDYVARGEDIENKVSTAYQKIAKPALTDVTVEWRNVDAVQVYPRPVTDLFYGTELTLMGRFKGRGTGSLIVAGRSGGRLARFEFPVAFPESAARASFLPRLWANMKVAHELDAIRLSGGAAPPEVVDEIVRLAKRYGIVTPYTSYLITEEGMDLRNAHGAAVRSFRQMASEARNSGFGGGAPAAARAQGASSFLSAMRVPAMAMSAPAAASAETAARAEAKARNENVAETLTLAGKTFYRRGSSWIDGEYELAEKDALPLTTVAYLSPDYFALIAAHPGISRYFAVGSEMIVVFNRKAYKVVPAI